ncbi:MAG TPA: hypothetical protein VFS53_04755 [Gemmatimonadota bacterium]|nr:hypothetical protein [Gemmatimonadota bacterium]
MSADAREDLGYVRDVVRRAERRAMPRAILWVWAAISVGGFAIIDVAPERAGLYWLVAGVAGFLLSAWIGARRARAIGQESEETGRRHMLHWAGMGVAIFLLSLGAEGWGSTPEASSHAILLMVALSYWLAGVHMVPALKWMGVVAAAVYVALAFLEGFPYPWTAAGIVIAAGLMVASLAGGTAGGES